MQDDKTFDWPRHDGELDDAPPSQPNNADVFRSWLNRAPQTRRRASFDPALYTWKGYRQWKDGVVNEAKPVKD